MNLLVLKHYITYSFCLALIIIAVSCSYIDKISGYENIKQQDSIAIWMAQADTATSGKIALLEKSYRAIDLMPSDSLRSEYLLKLSYLYFETEDTTKFREINADALKLTESLKDSLGLATAYWDLGDYFATKSYKIDSAYYYYSKAQQVYEKLDDNLLSARMLIKMANQQIEVKDYVASENAITKAALLLEPLDEYEYLYRCYNNLGIIANRLEDYDNAEEHHAQAQNYLRKAKIKNILVPMTYNNQGIVYKNQKKYKEAIEKYKEAEKYNDLYAQNPKWEATFIDNMAYAYFKMGNTVKVPGTFFDALKIRDSLNDIPGIIINKLHLAEYYTADKDTLNALKYAGEARELAKSSQNVKDLLSALLLLSELEAPEKRIAYLDDYVRINDSLQSAERKLSDRFARIRFETDKLTDRLNEKIYEVKRQLNITLIISGVIMAFGALLFIIVLQQSRNRKLKLDKARKELDMKTYDLILTQQGKVQEGRQQERKRISEELHDGALGDLFGTRLILDGLNLKTGNENTEKAIKEHLKKLQEIEKEIRGVSHELNAQSLVNQAGFVTLVVNLLETHSKISKFTFSKEGDTRINWEIIPGNVKANLYRIIQEAVKNISRYAKASIVRIEFEEKNNMLWVTIMDNGVGFNTRRKKTGIGIKNMRSRVSSLTGKMSIRSSINRGTEITVKIPLNL